LQHTHTHREREKERERETEREIQHYPHYPLGIDSKIPSGYKNSDVQIPHMKGYSIWIEPMHIPQLKSLWFPNIK
jgi:hypothetical protein